MAVMLDSLDFLPDHYEVAPCHEWRIMRMLAALETKVLPRHCQPACEFFRKDFDGGALCYDECDHWVFDAHEVKEKELVADVMFATNLLNPNEGFCFMIGLNHLVDILGKERTRYLVTLWRDTLKPLEVTDEEVEASTAPSL